MLVCTHFVLLALKKSRKLIVGKRASNGKYVLLRGMSVRKLMNYFITRWKLDTKRLPLINLALDLYLEFDYT